MLEMLQTGIFSEDFANVVFAFVDDINGAEIVVGILV